MKLKDLLINSAPWHIRLCGDCEGRGFNTTIETSGNISGYLWSYCSVCRGEGLFLLKESLNGFSSTQIRYTKTSSTKQD